MTHTSSATTQGLFTEPIGQNRQRNACLSYWNAYVRDMVKAELASARATKAFTDGDDSGAGNAADETSSFYALAGIDARSKVPDGWQDVSKAAGYAADTWVSVFHDFKKMVNGDASYSPTVTNQLGVGAANSLERAVTIGRVHFKALHGDPRLIKSPEDISGV